ncbi:MAG TPA: DUF5808 domain-containing protein [Bryobacteraceae bacterium]|jgi:uncharacterized membrane protein
MNASLIPVISVLGILFHFIPNWMRPELFFAVTVDPAFRRTREAANILHWYRIPLWIGTFAALAFIAATSSAAYGLFAPAGFLAGFLLAHRRTQPHAVEPSPIVEIDLAAPQETFPGGSVSALPPFAALAALALWAHAHWANLPGRIPIHWSFHGPDRFADRTVANVYSLIVLDAVICLVLLSIAWGIVNWSRRIFTSGSSAAYERRFRRINAQMLIAFSYWAAAQGWIALALPGVAAPWTEIALTALIVTTLAFLCYYVLLMVRAARSGAPMGDRTPDACWKLGIFYINPGDPSLWIPKRFGIGYTLNFGNRWSWALLGVLLAAVFAKSVLK